MQNRLGCLTFICALFGFGSMTSLDVFAKERLIFQRERANGFYYPLAYFLAKVAFDIVPLRVVPPLLLGSICYYMIGLAPQATHFAQFLLVLVLFNLAAAAVCLLVGILIRSRPVANLMASLTMLFGLLFSGFLLNKGNHPCPFLA